MTCNFLTYKIRKAPQGGSGHPKDDKWWQDDQIIINSSLCLLPTNLPPSSGGLIVPSSKSFLFFCMYDIISHILRQPSKSFFVYRSSVREGLATPDQISVFLMKCKGYKGKNAVLPIMTHSFTFTDSSMANFNNNLGLGQTPYPLPPSWSEFQRNFFGLVPSLWWHTLSPKSFDSLHFRSCPRLLPLWQMVLPTVANQQYKYLKAQAYVAILVYWFLFQILQTELQI